MDRRKPVSSKSVMGSERMTSAPLKSMRQITLPKPLPAPMKWRLLDGVMRYKGRDIIAVMLDDGCVQPFYRSSGRNSGMPGVWFPFDGLWPYTYPTLGWFIKDRFAHRGNRYSVLERFGTEFYASISAALAYLDISEGPEAIDLNVVNEWLGLTHLRPVELETAA